MPFPLKKALTAKAFSSLPRADQLEVLRQASSRQKLRLLVDAADGEELLALLPPQDLFLLARELGPDQVAELLTMATPEQWTAFFDFDCWHGDSFETAPARRWLAILLQGEEPWIVTTLLELDFELLVLLLHREVQVLSGPEEMEEDAAMAEGRRRERGYVLDYRDDDGAKLFGALIDILFRYAPDFCRYLLEAVRAEGESLLEESVFQMRAGRLLDQGLPDPQAAQAVYAWLDPENFAVAAARKIPLGGSEAGSIPGGALQLARPTGLLAEVLADGLDAGTAWELACLANKVLMADQADPGDLDAVHGIVKRSYGVLNLALEYLAESDPAAARRALHTAYAEELFRFGFSLTLRLQRRARDVHESPLGRYLDGTFRLLVDALRQRRPHYPESLVNPGHSGVKPFTSLRELRLVEGWLDRLEVQQRLFVEQFPFGLPAREEWELTGCHPAHGRDLTLPTIFLTALANRVLGRPFAPQPLAAAELAVLHGTVSRDGRIDPALREQTLAWLETLEPGGGIFGEECFALWEEAFCGVDAAAIDPRFVGGLIVRLTPAE